MANVGAIRSVTESLARYLKNAYEQAKFPPDIKKPKSDFVVVSSGKIAEENDPANATAQVLIFLYRVSMNTHLRNSGRLGAPHMRPQPLSLDLHLLFSVWTDSAESEHLILAWTMRELQDSPILDASTLSREAAWQAEDVVQLIPEELSNEDLMRIWDALTPSYRLSVSYIARVVRIDPDDDLDQHRPVVATRFGHGPVEP